MNATYPYRTTIQPVPEGTTRPLWSVMIPTYNCARYLRTTLESVLSQDPGADLMQIEVVDDCSTKDDPAAVVEEIGQGRVSFYRQPQNGGHTKNFATCLQRSRGQLIHLLHGDDCVRDGFYSKLQQAFTQNPQIGAAFCRHIFIDECGHWQSISPLEQQKSGILDNWLERIAVKQRIQTPSIVVRRDVYEQLGAFDCRLTWTEDWEMWVRIAAKYPVWYEVEPLALYRTHSTSNTARYICTGEALRDARRAIEIFQQYLPEAKASKLAAQAKEKWAIYALDNWTYQIVATQDFSTVKSHVREIFKCSHSPQVFQRLAKTFIMLGLRYFQQAYTKVVPQTGQQDTVTS
ncbi:glycosyltransferase [Chroococcidiopsis sp. TS-821]|uniref:glycosyltransferase family 2 protein n=1 Tax=Chroococcidiopsis sp. TS-821 TaxID=1378066 RepID=UPI000CED8FC9|nr:glycosyltransferase [Chroococcidiopsis sp. TS-821]PPS42802.1 family 2 glycosyl transferase [Chroococcidiopsis sp. TS-821]